MTSLLLALVIVQLREPQLAGKNAIDRREVIAHVQRNVLERHPDFVPAARWRNVAAMAGEATPEELERLAADADVVRVDPDTGGTGGAAQSMPLVGADIVHNLGYTGRNVVVAVLDSGVDLAHEDFSGRIADQHCFCRNADGSGCCPDGTTEQSGAGAAADDHGHGTNVTGILASGGAKSVAGMAPSATIVAVKVLDRNNAFASTTQVISALDWLLSHHREVRVVNMSLLTNALFGSYCDETTAFTGAFASAINALRFNGTAVFACSGNNANAQMMGAPACVTNAISVGAVYDASFGAFNGFGCSDATTTADRITCFSNSNTTLDLLGPGALITSSGRGNALSTFAGTSQATPHVAGAAAILFSIRPTLTVDQVETLLKKTGKPIVDERNGVTAPRLDILDAVQELLRPVPPRRRAVTP
ncbi:MAG TPA: S8 family serine peptidase [Thermoanaerobaculia bacterium]|nr:S8 family serine peptidase [Thermoanaerobaculia bacterium]